VSVPAFVPLVGHKPSPSENAVDGVGLWVAVSARACQPMRARAHRAPRAHRARSIRTCTLLWKYAFHVRVGVGAPVIARSRTPTCKPKPKPKPKRKRKRKRQQLAPPHGNRPAHHPGAPSAHHFGAGPIAEGKGGLRLRHLLYAPATARALHARHSTKRTKTLN
jgi:hypothetical protein